MYRLKERAKRLIGEVGSLLYKNVPCDINLQMREGKIEFPCDFEEIKDGFNDFQNGDFYAKDFYDKYCLFKINVKFPEVNDGEDLYLNICTNQGGHNMLKPQMLLYKDGVALQGLDTNHKYVKLSEFSGTEQNFHLYAFSGLCVKTPYGSWIEIEPEKGVRLYVNVVTRNCLLWDYYMSVKTAFSHINSLAENSAEYVKIIHAVNDSLALLDLRHPYSEAFFESLKKANDFIENELYSKTYEDNGKASVIGHTHLDVAWLWRYEHTRDKVLRSFATETKLFEEYEDHRFMSSQAQLYSFVKEQQPELFERIKEYVKAGKWEVEGAMWVEPDMNLASGESIVRQILYGKRFFMEEFGVDCKVLWLPDVFGYSAALPQILKKSGVDYFMTAKLYNCDRNRFPYDTFNWKGIDGSKVFSHLLTYMDTTYNPDVENAEILRGYRKYNQKDINDDILVAFGFADGGGGPSVEQVETVLRLKNGLPGIPKTEYRFVKDYFIELEAKVKDHKRLPCWNGELYYENHRGTYTSMGRIKRQNRKAERLYQNAEWLWSMADQFEKAEFPKADYDKCMEKILINQFHDVLPGTSIKEVYNDSDKLYDEIYDYTEKMIESSISRMIDKDKDAVTVFNPYSENVSGYINYNGKRHFVENISAKGAVTLDKLQHNVQFPVNVNSNVIENKYYIITLNKNGSIESLFDKINNRECFIKGKEANKLRVFEDKCWFEGEDNWNLDNYYKMHEYEMPMPYSIKVVENNGEYAIIRIERKYESSIIIQNMVVYANSPRIDFENVIDWKEHSQILKAEFPVDVNTNKAKYEIQFGYVERSTASNTSWDEAKFEVCAHKWADISDGGYGMALLNDCKYGHSAEDSTLSLTLLRCGNSPNPDSDKEKHYFTYSIIPHNSDFTVKEITKEAYLLNNPLFAVKGALKTADKFSLFKAEGAVLDTVKPAEDGNGYVLRLYEPSNKSSQVKIYADAKLKVAEFTDIMENPLNEKPEFSENEISFNIKPFEIVTLRVWFE